MIVKASFNWNWSGPEKGRLYRYSLGAICNRVFLQSNATQKVTPFVPGTPSDYQSEENWACPFWEVNDATMYTIYVQAFWDVQHPDKHNQK